MGEGDSPETHFTDTVTGGADMSDKDAARYFCNAVIDEIYRLDSWGVPWTRVVAGKKRLSDGRIIHEPEENHGKIAGRNFGGTAKWRTCYCSDATGHDLVFAHTREAAARNIPMYDRCMALSLIIDGSSVCGAVCLDMRKMKLFAVEAHAVIIATGGYGKLFQRSTNGAVCTGSGHDLVLKTGIGTLANMEAVQFHPTCLVPSSLLITEGCRGDGGHLLDADNGRFMKEYCPDTMECSRRDEVSRAMVLHHEKGLSCNSGQGPHFKLDIRHLGKTHILRHLREVYELCTTRLDLNPVKQCIPVFPAQHYSMGGIRTDFNHSAENYGLSGLYAVGEAACWDMHGFNRLGGNSLGETVVSGRHAVEAVIGRLDAVRGQKTKDTVVQEEYSKQYTRFAGLEKNRGQSSAFLLFKRLQKSMSAGLGVFREEEGINKTIGELYEIQKEIDGITLQSSMKSFTSETQCALELPGAVRLALSAAYGALYRRESRGCHNRRDYPETDSSFRKRTLIRWDHAENRPEITYEEINETR